MNGMSSVNSSPFKSPIQSPVKASDRYIPLRSSHSATNLHFDTPLSPQSSCASSSVISSPKKRKYEQNQAGLGVGVTGSEPDLAMYHQLLKNTLLNTNVDVLKTSDIQNECIKPVTTTITDRSATTPNDNGSSSPLGSSIFKYSERVENPPPTSAINKTHFSRSSLSSANIHLLYSPKKTIRRIPKIPYKVLDAPDLQDDFYLNLIDWSQTNILSVGLGSCVYLCHAQTNNVTLLCDLTQSQIQNSHYMSLHQQHQSDSVTSVAWADRASLLAVGTHRGHVHIYDVQTQKRVQTISKHSGRVGALAWNEWALCSGSRDRSIIEHDNRTSTTVHTFHGHTQEVCGLKWSTDKSILASGGNDNRLLLWSNTHQTNYLQSFNDHLAAVKAIAWSPHQHGLLASGGGTADRHIRFRSSLTCQTLSVCDTGSQVCQLVWSKNSPNELASTHGFSQNQIVVWKYPTMQPLAKLFGHQQRVLYLSMSPDGESIVTGAGDETLRFWHVFAKSKCVRNPDNTQYMSCTDNVHVLCNCSLSKNISSSVYETLEEFDFRRGIWSHAQNNDYDELKKFIEDKKSTLNINQKDSSGYTALHYSVRHQPAKIVLLLLENKADPNIVTNAGHSTPLHRAALFNNLEAVKYLIDYGAKVDIKDIDGLTPLERAQRQSHTQIVEFLSQNIKK
ncbi:unnamed protein product [Didymodactylos carnosus]|uniref:CDC20/Fizzy WD40 domain-containing protein n=1 Tax=Didymodactylos carnosus TaxID=1234261 RepID=A0A8S2LGJ0_9BILA|nr:unnamed protein product [Didymodactylos carnosus]CAF3889739.1 unnamed protein product [Didymodactylos carnosus]